MVEKWSVARTRMAERIRSSGGIIDAHTHVGVSFRSYLDYAYPYCLSFEDLVIRMKYLGISYSVIFPSDSSYYAFEPGGSKTIRTTEEFAKFPYEIANQNLFKEIYEIFPECADMAIPFARFDPSRKTEEQVELLQRLHSTYPLCGLKTVTTYIQSFVRDMETIGRPILDFAMDHDLPITFHSSYYKGDPWASVYDIVRFAATHPEVRICIAHSARFVRSVLDQAAALQNCFVDLSAFDIHCLLARMESPAIPPEEERFEADYGEPSSVMRKLADAYPTTVIWGTDFPANYFIKKYYGENGVLVDSHLKSSFDTETRILGELSREQRERIAYGNTLRFLFGHGEPIEPALDA